MPTKQDKPSYVVSLPPEQGREFTLAVKSECAFCDTPAVGVTADWTPTCGNADTCAADVDPVGDDED